MNKILTSINILNSFNIKKAVKEKNISKKTKPAQDGEIRHWKNGSYQRKSAGHWVKISSEKEGDIFTPTNISKELKNLLPNKFFKKLGRKPDIRFFKEESGPFYSPSSNRIYLNKTTTYFDKFVFVHELGHYFHTNKNIIKNGHVDKTFKTEIFDSLLEEFNSSFSEETKESYKNLNKGGIKNMPLYKYQNLFLKFYDEFDGVENIDDKATVYFDIIESITKGDYGFGHGKSYYRGAGKGSEYDEIFAHTMQIYFMKNEILEKYFPKSFIKIKQYYSNLFK